MTIKLTDTQKLLLSVAAEREDRCLVMPATLKGGAARKVVAKLIDAGVAREIVAKLAMPVWRRDDETNRPYALRATAAGVKAVGSENAAMGDDIAPSSAAATEAVVTRAETGNESGGAKTSTTFTPPSAPRVGTKIAHVVALLNRDFGATLEELVAATGWLPHTTRAALTGLRKRGFTLSIDRSDKTRGGAYRIVCNDEPQPAEIAAQQKARSTPAARPRKSATSTAVPARKAA